MQPEPQIFAKLRTLPPEQFLSLQDLSPVEVGSNGQSLLQEAIAFKRPVLVSALIARGVPIDHQNKTGQTALHYAAIYGCLPSAEALMASGANPNICDKHGNGPLWAAALSTNREPRIIALLAKAGADPTHKNKAGRSVLDFARQSNNEQLWVMFGHTIEEFRST